MSQSTEELYEEANRLSQRAEELFAERDQLKQQASQLRVEYQPRIDELKTEANELAGEFKELYRQAQEAFASGDGASAKVFSIEGHEKQSECEALNEEVAELIAETKEQVGALYQRADEKHREAIVCIREAERLRTNDREVKKTQTLHKRTELSPQGEAGQTSC